MSFEISFLVQKINQVKEITRGGWSGFGMATVGIDPTDFKLNPTKIPPGGVVQNSRVTLDSIRNSCDVFF